MVNLPLRLFDHWIVLFDEKETKSLKVDSVVGHIRHASLCDYEVIVISDLTSSTWWSQKFNEAIIKPIKTITEFSDMIGYHQSDLSTNWTV